MRDCVPTATSSATLVRKRSRNCIGRLCFWYVASTAVTIKILAVPAFVDGFTLFGTESIRNHLQQHRVVFSRSTSKCTAKLSVQQRKHTDDDIQNDSNSEPDSPISRRDVFRRFEAATTTTLLVALSSSNVANAARAEFDSTTGNLFTPKADMLSGGSDAARGLPISRNRVTLSPGQPLQSIYEPRFVAYLSRFLLNFDPAARAYWVQQGFGDSWELPLTSTGADGDRSLEQRDRSAESVFAEFAQSVEVGLADYFSGPFGSYSSLPAMVAGINAAQPAQSMKVDSSEAAHGFLKDIFGGGKSMNKQKKAVGVASAKQGILNLYTLLKARYTSISAKRQLAILFSFVSSLNLQPVSEICSLLGEADNATVTGVAISNMGNENNEADSRTSSRRGGGYAYGEFPAIIIDSPPPLGDKYRNAQLQPVMKPTTRVLRIKLTDRGEGYTAAPTVTVLQNNGLVIRQCQATAILDREGHVQSVFVLDPGYGYGGGRKTIPPKVIIEPPTSKKPRDKSFRTARAFAQLEYKIFGVQIIDGGTGFAATEPPKVKISPPMEDPDWYLDVQESPTMRMVPIPNREPLTAAVTEMRFADGNVAYSSNGMPDRSNVINDNLIERLVRDPLELLPSTARPELIREPRTGKMIYSIPQLAIVPQFVAVMSPRYRAYDPIFGGVGRIPVTKGANALTVSEYARLALSGAVCTVAVRTALNPLELIKTKQQLENDAELFEYARRQVNKTQLVEYPTSNVPIEANQPSQIEHARFQSGTATLLAPSHQVVSIEVEQAPPKIKVGTVQMIRSIIELRGPLALFQSADITFLASLVFGSLGFGATELFRRSFTSFFLSENGGVKNSASESELVLLFAASVATVLTALAASPFEVLRVRSMGLISPKKWTSVLEDFLREKSPSKILSVEKRNSDTPFDLKSLRLEDISPLWSGFAPILSRELPFAIAKFLVFDLLATTTVAFLNSQNAEGSLPIQVGVGPTGLAISALSGAFAGIAGAIVSHPADLILTKTSATRTSSKVDEETPCGLDTATTSLESGPAWVGVIRELVAQDGGISNLFVGLGSRSIFFFLVIGLQFFLYDYVKGLFQVSSDDLTLVLDVFYAVRAGLVGLVET